MVETSSRMLAALEEYSERGTKHEKVVLESLKLRTSLATSIWSSQEGVLDQLMKEGPTTTFSMKLDIATFGDVLLQPTNRSKKPRKDCPCSDLHSGKLYRRFSETRPSCLLI